MSEEKLKTLKDCKTLEEAREEAIKWIKECYTYLPEKTIIFTGRESQMKTWNRKSAQIEWIKHFFNIIEDDLKEKKENE